MKSFLALILAFIAAGCCHWQDTTRPEFTGTVRHWMASKWSEDCNCPRFIYLHDLPPEPERHLYVIDELTEHTKPCLIGLRPAFVSDTGRTYRWDELPNVFDPCP